MKLIFLLENFGLGCCREYCILKVTYNLFIGNTFMPGYFETSKELR